MRLTKWIARALMGGATAALLALAVVAYGGTSDNPGGSDGPRPAMAPGQPVEPAPGQDTAAEAEPTETPTGEAVATASDPCADCATTRTSSREQGKVRAQSRRAVVGIGGSAGKGGGGPEELFGQLERGQPEDTTFRDYSRLPFVATSVNPVSTFSLDVDRTSYLLALTWGQEPLQRGTRFGAGRGVG